MVTPNKDLNTPVYDSSNWDVPLNENFNWIDSSLGATVNISVAGVPAPPVTLTIAQRRSMSIVFSGLLGNNVNYQIPSGAGGNWTIYNTTTGAFTLTISSAGAGSSVIIPQNQSRAIISDGTNIKFEDVYGAANQVLFNTGSGINGDAAFTFSSGVMSVTRSRLGDGTTALPALSATTATTTGISFPVVNEMAISTNAIERARFNAAGAIALGSTTDYGDAGDVIKSAGNAAPAAWGLAGAVVIGQQTASGTSVTFSGLNLTLYKFVVMVVSGVGHNSGGSRNLLFGTDTVGSSITGADDWNGMIVLHPASGTAFVSTGRISGGLPYSTGFASNYNTASTSIVMSINGTGAFDSGTLFLLGIA